MKNNYTQLALGLAMLLPFLATGQISFTNSNFMLNETDFHSGVAICVADMNGDGLDDIAHLSEGEELYIEYQQENGSFRHGLWR